MTIRERRMTTNATPRSSPSAVKSLPAVPLPGDSFSSPTAKYKSGNGETATTCTSDIMAVHSVNLLDEVDTIDDSSHNKAISPVARKILLTSNDELFEDLEFGDEGSTSSMPKSPLAIPVNDDEYEEMLSRSSSAHSNYSRSRHESNHSLPDVEGLKIAVAAASARLSSRRNRKSICYALFALLVVTVLALIVFGAVAAGRHGDQNEDAFELGALDDPDAYFNHQGTALATYDDRIVHLQNYFVRQGITRPDQFLDARTAEMTTPQSKAMAWLANQDKAFPSLPRHDQGLDTPEGYKFVMRYAMTVLYFATGGHHWHNDLNFLNPEKSTCDWFHVFPAPMGQVGVLCDQTTQEIVGLSMISNNLMGTLPTEISQLTTLRYLESIGNDLGGTIPKEWRKLQNLSTLVMAFNSFSGPLPSWMPLAWPDLEFLYLSNNELTGKIPDDFYGFHKLSVLALDDNLLTGNTDEIWESLPTLEYLYLEDNGFTGTLPRYIKQSTPNLINLDVSSNLFHGGIPEDVFLLPKLQILDLHDNRFDSSIPDDIPQNNDRLQFLALHNNVLGGTIPSTIANLRHLSHLDVTHNKLSGTIPIQLEKLSSSLTYLFLGANFFKEGPVPSLVYTMNNLRELSLKSLKLTGSISGMIGALDSLLVLDLDDNQLTGSIPQEIGMLTNLQFLLLNRNQLTSSVPSEALAKLKKLRVLLLDNNSIIGDLNPVCGLESLSTVYVDCGEVACLEDCCLCCEDGKDCHGNSIVASQDPLWEGDYRRQFFDFSGKGNGNGRFYPNRDDDYWQ
mmetsp:Transcript_16910/g.38778  ORF Transcript_16910/g.38778 Transcript_16910/m.38778 type:complete len:789 (-) Transcript_16910:51-2417(-)